LKRKSFDNRIQPCNKILMIRSRYRSSAIFKILKWN